MSSITNIFVDLLKQVFIICVFLFKIPFLWLEPTLHLHSGKKDRPMPKYSDYIIASKYTARCSPTRKTFSFCFGFPRYSPSFAYCSGNSVFGLPLYFRTTTETTGVTIAKDTEFSSDPFRNNPKTILISTTPRRIVARKGISVQNMTFEESDARRREYSEIVEDCSIPEIERVHSMPFAVNQPWTFFGVIRNDNVEARRSFSTSLKISRSASDDEKKAKGKVHKKYNRRGSHKSKKASPTLESPPITEATGLKRANTY